MSDGDSRLLDEFETAVSRHREANANFSRCSPGEIADRTKELKAARKAIEDRIEALERAFIRLTR